MRKALIVLYAMALALATNAQILREQTTPKTIGNIIPGYAQVTIINTVSVAFTPPAPLTQPTPIDGDTTTEGNGVYDFGAVISVSINLSSGNFTNTSVGKVWTLRVSVPNALSIGLTFNQFNLSPSAEMYIYNDTKTVLNKAIKKEHFVNSDTVSISSINGNAIVVYIIEPNNFGNFQSSISIIQLVGGYQEISDVGDVGGGTNMQQFRATINCIPHVQCYNWRMMSARAIARIEIPRGNNRVGLCTGTLLNNEQNNGRAFLLTAFHCIDANDNNIIDADEIQALRQARFQFQFWRTVCNGTTNNDGIQFNDAILLSQNRASDMVLLELINPPGVGDGVNYAGWSRQTNRPSDYGSYIIHHPRGGDMRYTQTRFVRNYLFNSNYWQAGYNEGVVDRGSSGSALFNENNQVIGQLKGGWSSCNYTDFSDRYGKFSRSWDNGNLQQWLAPNQNLNSINPLIISPITIIGEDYFGCPSPDNTYSVPNLYGCTYTWTHSPNLMLVSGQNTSTAVFRSISTLQSDFGWIQVTINDSKGRNRTATATKNVQMGLSQIETISFSNGLGTEVYFCTSNRGNKFEIFPQRANVSYEYRLLSWPSLNVIYTNPNLYGGTPIYVTHYPPPGWYVLEVRMNTPCGATGWVGYEVEFVDCTQIEGGGFFRVQASPNPTSSDLYITIDKEKDEVKALKTSENINFVLYDFNRAQSIKQWTYKNDQKQYRLNVSGIRQGQYILVVTKGKYRQSTQIIIK